MAFLETRATRCYETVFGDIRCRSRWHEWGRWVAFGVIVGVAILAFFLIACINARRRRRRGLTPYYGTQWMAPQHPPPPPYQQHPNDPQQSPPPPQYSSGQYGQPSWGQTYELPQQPGPAYQTPNDNVYPPPPGPPPNKY
ncbi:hypothetical protein VTN31DRAFT_108 [Thermomyces dupontii]|uniref:uncharacterized protein n=1 Tax=Talaromyces thermophilus TaxID=28565 RepID=UPI0037431416